VIKHQRACESYVLRNDGGFTFLNTSVDDLEGSKLFVQDLIRGSSMRIWSHVPASLSLYSINEQDGMLLNHCRPQSTFSVAL
jgi:hypothetical protein